MLSVNHSVFEGLLVIYAEGPLLPQGCSMHSSIFLPPPPRQRETHLGLVLFFTLNLGLVLVLFSGNSSVLQPASQIVHLIVGMVSKAERRRSSDLVQTPPGSLQKARSGPGLSFPLGNLLRTP